MVVVSDKSIVIGLQFVHDSPFTAVALTPSPNAQNIYPDPVTVTLSATATDSFTIDATYYTIDGGSTQTYSGPFTVSGDGSHTIQYWSVDNLGVFELTKTLTFQIASLRITTESPLPSGTVGVPYATILEAAGGTPPYTWAVASGALPTGLNLNASTGEISGTPTTAGTFGFSIQVTDSSANTASKPFAVDGPAPSGTAGSDYTVPVNIDPDAGNGGSGGGGEPTTCSNYTVTAGALPAGLTLDPATGIVTGTPTDGGTYNFTIGCTVDSGPSQGQTATKEFTITINNPLPTLSSLDPDMATAGGGDLTLTLNGTNFVQSSVVRWNGADRITVYISDTQLQITVPADDMTAPGTASVSVFNPDPVGGESNTLTFTINPPNQPPTVQAGGPYTVDEGGSVTLNASGNDPDGDALTYAWDLDNNGSFETPGQSVPFSAVAQDGPSSHAVAVQVTDPAGLSATADATVDVQNVAATANAGADQTVFRNQPVTVSGAWTDPAGVLDNPYAWSWDLDGDGVDDESGSANYNETISRQTSFIIDGTAILTFTVTDKDGGTSSDTVHITVVNRAPTADNQDVNTDEDTTLAITLSAHDDDGDALAYSVLTQPDHGELSGAAPMLVYTPAADYNGPDAFTFKVNDGLVDSNVATINITVNPVNDPPVALDDTATTDEDTPVTVNVQANDSAGPDNENQALTTTAVTTPAHGAAAINTDGSILYTPSTDYNGPDGFAYTVCDSDGACTSASVTILVAMVNDPPVANDDNVTTPEDTPVAINVAANDSDVDNNLNPASATALTEPAHGQLVNNGNGSFSYTPNANYFGEDGFSYQICDGDTVCDNAAVAINVTPVNDNPVCNAATPSVSSLWPPEHQFEPVTVNGISDIEDDPMTIAITSIFQDEPVDAPGSGNTSPDGQGIGSATAEVRAERVGSGNGRVYHISFTASDGQGGSCTGEVLVGVPKSQGNKGAPVDDGALYDSIQLLP
ncbi:MAG: Ig-like domain-containing protein [Caldilineaceae bacterium]